MVTWKTRSNNLFLFSSITSHFPSQRISNCFMRLSSPYVSKSYSFPNFANVLTKSPANNKLMPNFSPLQGMSVQIIFSILSVTTSYCKDCSLTITRYSGKSLKAYLSTLEGRIPFLGQYLEVSKNDEPIEREDNSSKKKLII